MAGSNPSPRLGQQLYLKDYMCTINSSNNLSEAYKVKQAISQSLRICCGKEFLNIEE